MKVTFFYNMILFAGSFWLTPFISVLTGIAAFLTIRERIRSIKINEVDVNYNGSWKEFVKSKLKWIK